MGALEKSKSNDLASNLEGVLIQGDLSRLNSSQKLSYYKSVCDSIGLNTLTKPFEYIRLNGKEVLYATRACTEQLRKLHSVSVEITSRDKFEDLYVVTAKASLPDGRVDESTGAVNLHGLKGDALANALMKAETKAKRRVTLSVCGLGLLDESEVQDIPVESDAGNERGKVSNPLKDVSPEKYVVDFGKYKGMKIEEIDPYELRSYIEYIHNSALEQGKPIKGKVKDFLDKAEERIKALTPEEKEHFDDFFDGDEA